MTDYGEGLRPGTRIREFEIERELGSGGFGVTYLARDLNLGRRVAVKEYLPSEWGTRRTDGTVGPRFTTSAEDYSWGLDRFLEEARVLARLDHRGIVKVYQVVPDAGTAYMVMEYVKGHTLASELRSSGPMPEARVLPVLAGIADGLAVVHAADMLHRDVKADNVMLREGDGAPVLIDFGAARQDMGRHSRSLIQMLTPGYAPLEQHDSKGGQQGPWTDVYALGAVAYEALTGRLPDEAPGRVISDHLPPLDAVAAHPVGPALAKAVMAALAVLPGDRPQTVGEWLEMLGRRPTTVPVGGGGARDSGVGRSEVPEARRQPSAPRRKAPPEPSPEVSGRPSRRPWAWAAGGLGAAAALMLLWLAVGGRGGDGPSAGPEAAEVDPPPSAAINADSLARVVEEGLALERSEVRLVQRGLLESGFDPGAQTGFLGSGTREALRRWQASRGMAETGFLGVDAADQLLEAGRAAEAEDSAALAQEAAEAEAEAARQRADSLAEAQRAAEARRADSLAEARRAAEARREAEARRLADLRRPAEVQRLHGVP